MQPIIKFRLAQPLEQAMLLGWFDEPHIKEFWDNSESNRKNLTDYLSGHKNLFDYWIGSIDQNPYCMIMTSDAKDGNPPLLKPYLSSTGKTWTIDFMIGNKNYLGKGLASTTLDLFTRYIPQLIDVKVDTWLIDPAADNTKAVHVYTKAGFEKVSEFTPVKGYFANKLHYLMLKKVKPKNDDVILESYNPNWPLKAKQEIELLKKDLNFPWLVDIQHFGSTAVKGLSAKPIIDIIIGVTDLEQAKTMIPIIENMGYLFWDENPKKDRFFFVKGMPPYGKQRTHHVHVFETTSYEWHVRQLFRDYLNSHTQALRDYQHLKEQLADKYKTDREGYTQAKEGFIKDIVQKAMFPLVSFQPLVEKHCSLLLKWLEAPHVKAQWDQDITYDLSLVKEKFGRHIHTHHPKDGVAGLTYAYVIMINDLPIGYIQFYNARDFSEENKLNLAGLPDKIAGCDVFIGEHDYVGKGLGVGIMQKFCNEHIFLNFAACLVDPDRNNISAIKAFKKAGFKKLINQPADDTLWMIYYENEN